MHTAAALRVVPLGVRRAQSRDYAAFGGILRSELELPELAVARGGLHPDWSLRVATGLPPAVDSTLIGERTLREECYRLWQHAEGLRLEYSHAGTFDISNDGKLIVWYEDESVSIELVRNIVLGPAIALALEAAGFLCLHGSAVALRGAAIGFLGPKYFGKSTLATALTGAGGQLVADDLLVVRPGPPASICPGVASVRLWSDMAAALPLDSVCNTVIDGVKTTGTGFAEKAIALSQCPIKAIYLLSPFRLDGTETRAASRVRLEPTEAAITLAQQTKLPDSLIGLRGAASQLALAAAIATSVPVWRLHFIHDITKLDTVIRQIIDWSSAET